MATGLVNVKDKYFRSRRAKKFDIQYQLQIKKSIESFNLFVNVFSFLSFLFFAVGTR